MKVKRKAGKIIHRLSGPDRSTLEELDVKFFLSLMVALSLMLLAMPTMAGDGETGVAQDGYQAASTTKGPFYSQSEAELRSRKLCRGLANVFLCVAEIPNQMFRQAYETSPVTGSVVGAWEGVKKGGKRLAVGTWEVLTFFHPTKNHYQPIVEPEVVFMEYLH